MKVLVTGGTGYLGRTIVRCLMERGHIAVVFSRSATRSGTRGIAVDGDVRDEQALRRAADGCDAICHSAALVSVWRKQPRDFDDINVGGLVNVLRVARSARVERVVYTSSFLALPPTGRESPLEANDYQRTKVAALTIARRAMADGAPIVCVIPGVIYGPGVHTEGNLVGNLLRDHLAGRLPGLIGADRRWSYAHVEDVAAGHEAALVRGHPGKEYRLCGENVPQIRVFECLREITGSRLPRRIPYAAATAIALIEETRAAIFSTPPRLTRGVVQIFRHEWAYDSNLAIHELGYRIRPLREGIKQTVQELARGTAVRT
jgi:nucleoside-diphosphate-sugar epimerase